MTPSRAFMPFVFRIQDAEGRGPYRPGTSHRWADVDGPVPPPPFYEEFGQAIFDHFKAGWANGCAFETMAQLTAWFSPTERARLAMLGYRIVRFRPDRILGASENQMVVSRQRPFRDNVLTIAWPDADDAQPVRQKAHA